MKPTGATMANGLTALSKSEQDTLSCCETDIERGGRLVASAMETIRDKRLYRLYGTFDDYCRERWNIRKDYANKLIRHEGVVRNLAESGLNTNCIQIPEAATREIADLPADKQVEVVQKAAENGNKPTAKAVKAARDQVAPKTRTDGKIAGGTKFDPAEWESSDDEEPVDTTLIVEVDKAASAVSRKLAKAADIHGEGKHYGVIFKSIAAIKKACAEWGGLA